MTHIRKGSEIKKKVSHLTIIILMLFLMIFISSNLITTNLNRNDSIKSETTIDNNPQIANGESILFHGTEAPLNINDTGNLYEMNQEILVSNQEELNLSYYLDDVHDWEVSKIATSIINIQDTRNWVNNSGLIPPTIFRQYQNFNSSPNYLGNEDWDTKASIIYEPNANYMRAHFQTVDFELNWDYIYVYNDSYSIFWVETGYWSDLYTPWILGNTINIGYQSDSIIEYDGYVIDYYEFINDSSNYDSNFYSWGVNSLGDGGGGKNTHGIGTQGNKTAMYTGLYGTYVSSEEFIYTEGTFTEFYQNISIPRGQVIDAYLQFEYNAEFGIDTNDNNIYVKINNQKIYSKGMKDIVDSGKNIWRGSGKITMDLWTNSSNIFNPSLNNQNLNISIGLYCGGGYTYTNFNDGLLNVVWFDNISLVVSTIANSSQDGINLTLNSFNLNEENEWGKAYLNITDNWVVNPILLTVNTTSPSLNFELNTTLYGSKISTSKVNQQNDDGISYTILNNQTIYWEFYHNFYMPSQYSDFEFIIDKPTNWDLLYSLDPTLLSIPFEGGEVGENFIKINKEFALFPGWWTFVATSPNYLEINNTKMLKQGQWAGSSFITGESTRIKTQINHSNEVPPNLTLTTANLTIYDPSGSLWYQESTNPLANGTVLFSEFGFSALNSTGGQYNFTIFWSNGTSLGGIESNFILNHLSSLALLKPNDAQLDLRTEGFVGDIIPIRVFLTDAENNLTISNSNLSYNWTDGTRYFTESALGIYETVIDTADLLTRGLHKIFIESSKIGFFKSNITLEINLGEVTNLQVLESEYNIELHANSTIRFKFSDFDGDGIDGATVNIGISNESLYSIQNPGNGTYNIEFSTLFIDNVGIHQININFSAISYESQYYIYQFQIIKQSVNLSVYINSKPINENSLEEANFNDELNISVQAISNIDNEYLSGAINCIGSSYQDNLTEYGNFWFNTTIICSPDNFSFGINFIYLQFENPNYRTTTFGFQLLVNQIEIKVNSISFEDSINAEIGETINIQIQLVDNKTSLLIEDASITYRWDYGIGIINETLAGNYQVSIKLPANLQGNYKFDLFITPEGSIYKTTQYSFIVVIGEPNITGNGFPSLLLWIIIGVLVSIVSILGVLSLRSYVILPRKRKKEAELLSKTQKFKDLRNIQAIVIVHRLSGIPLYTKTYSILEKHKRELFSGFIQAITTIGEEFTETEKEDKLDGKKDRYGIEKIIELDFKYFYCLIADKEDIRIVFILAEKSSERLRSQMSHLLLALNLKLSQKLENWDGSLDMFEEIVPMIIGEYFELYYKGSFTIPRKLDLLKIQREKSLSKMEIRVLNVIQSMSKRNDDSINLNSIIELVSEENKDLVIEAIEVLIEQKLIIPINP
ncbi:MAG: hypothetical protein KGD65_11920 [Candidatus Lokiarchaeota archaeon]|nr:hypothetical protein [Candidatus Lokiarchaeota archaeon]